MVMFRGLGGLLSGGLGFTELGLYRAHGIVCGFCEWAPECQVRFLLFLAWYSPWATPKLLMRG